MIPGGYAGKWLDIDLTNNKIEDITFPYETLEQFFGGRGMATKILWDRVADKWTDMDGLDPENPLIFATGPMTGIYPGARICVSGKSPVSNGVVGSTAATEFAVEIKNTGYDGIIFTGKSPEPVYLLVTDDGPELVDAKHLWGLDGETTLIKLNKEVKETLTKRHPNVGLCLLYTSPSPRDLSTSRMPSSA